MKKNYTKKRSNFQNSQTSRDAVDSAEQELKKMSFLVWLNDFIRPRLSKSSFDDSESLLEGNQEEHRIFTEEDGDIGEEPDETEFLGDDDSYCITPNIVEGIPKINSTQTKNQQPPKRKLQESKESELDKQKISFLKTISQRMESRDKKKTKTLKVVML